MDNASLVALLEDCAGAFKNIGYHGMAARCIKAMTALRSGEVVLCPKEPTDEVCRAIMDATIADTSDLPSRAAYRAMLAAASRHDDTGKA